MTVNSGSIEASGPVARLLARSRAHPAATDRLGTAVLLVAGMAGLWLVRWSKTDHYRAPDTGAVLLILAVVVPLVWRRRHPAVVLIVSGSAWFAYQAANYPFGLAWLATFWAVYSYACHRRRDVYWPLVVWLAEVLGVLGFGRRGDAQTVIVFLGVTAFVWVRGDAIRTARVEAEREREARAQRAVADERARIAMELHDVVAHALGIIVMQAGGAGSVPGLGEPQAKAVLGNIERTGRQAFAEMRRLVGVLRDDQAGAELAPQPTIAQIGALATSMAGSGLDVAVEVIGEARPAPVGVELAAYRVVQEALTNTFKHAGSTRATVTLAWSAAALRVDIDDQGPAAGSRSRALAADSGGNGLVGMRERVSVYGGDFSAGPRPDGGFRVSARFPLGAPA